MNEKIELLKELIEKSELTVQQKINKIIQTLIRTEDPIKARILSNEILDGKFDKLENQSILNLVTAFNDNESIVVSNQTEYNDVKEDTLFNKNDSNENKAIKTLEYQLKVMQSQMESLEYNNNKKMKELEELNNKRIDELTKSNNELSGLNSRLVARLSLTKNSKLIEVSDESINELYIRNLETAVTEYDEAFIVKGIVPKTYYKLNNREGE